MDGELGLDNFWNCLQNIQMNALEFAEKTRKESKAFLI